MPLFAIANKKLAPIEQTNFAEEKVLHALVEANLQTVFACRLVASEFPIPTGTQHEGRIDTLALSKANNPVIIEYKKVEAPDLINQSLFYLACLKDRRGNFEIAVQKSLGAKVEVDWSDVRVICIAPRYRRYDLRAVQVKGAKIELWTYRLFKNQTLYIEEVLRRSYAPPEKAALARAAGAYTFDQHISGKPAGIREIALAVEEFVTGLDAAIEEAPKKFYVAYRTSRNIACMKVQRREVILYLKLDPTKVAGPSGIWQDVSDIGHYGTGDLKVTLKSLDDFEAAKPFIRMAYEEVGG
jgi:predicted transport protein